MFDSIKDRFGIGHGRDDYDDEYGYDDQDYPEDDYDDYEDNQDPDDQPSQGYDRYAPVTTRNAGTHRSYGSSYTDRAESDLGQRCYSATHPALVSRRDIRHSTSHIMGQGEIPERYGRQSVGRASDYTASGSETDYHVDTSPDQVADDIDAEEERREGQSSVSRFASFATGRSRHRASRGASDTRAGRSRHSYEDDPDTDEYGYERSSRDRESRNERSYRRSNRNSYDDAYGGNDTRDNENQRSRDENDASGRQFVRPSSRVGVTARKQEYDDAGTTTTRVQRGRRYGSFVNKAARDVVVVAPQDYAEVEKVSKALKEGNAVVLRLNATKHSLAKRVLDFSFGVASALDGRVDCIADKVFVITRGSALTEGERQKLRDLGVIQ